MTGLQEDLIETYNNLVAFSKTTVSSENPLPIKVWLDRDKDGYMGSRGDGNLQTGSSSINVDIIPYFVHK